MTEWTAVGGEARLARSSPYHVRMYGNVGGAGVPPSSLLDTSLVLSSQLGAGRGVLLISLAVSDIGLTVLCNVPVMMSRVSTEGSQWLGWMPMSMVSAVNAMW